MLKEKTVTYKPEKSISFLLFFFLCSLIGWFWEAAIYWFAHSPHASLFQIVCNFRGVLHGLWVPIYGVGCILILSLKQYTGNHPIRFFFISSAACGLVEYVTSWLLETVYHARWWNYSSQFLNLNGRISLLSVLFFGFAGIVVAYFVKPFFDKLLCRFSKSAKLCFCAALSILFLIDCFYSLTIPNMGIGVDVFGR